MQLKINGEQPFQVLSTNFTIGPSESGYDLYFSADGISGYSKLFTVGANTNRQVTQVAAGSYYILSGNTDEVTVNWIKECGGQGGGGGSYVLPTASETTLGGVKIGSGITIDENGAISAEGGSAGGPKVVYFNQLSKQEKKAVYDEIVAYSTADNFPAGDYRFFNYNNEDDYTGYYELFVSRIASTVTFSAIFKGRSNTKALIRVHRLFSDGDWSNDVSQTGDFPYTLPTASDSALGGIKVGSGLTIDSGGTLSVSGGSAQSDYLIVDALSAITNPQEGQMAQVRTEAETISFNKLYVTDSSTAPLSEGYWGNLLIDGVGNRPIYIANDGHNFFWDWPDGDGNNPTEWTEGEWEGRTYQYKFDFSGEYPVFQIIFPEGSDIELVAQGEDGGTWYDIDGISTGTGTETVYKYSSPYIYQGGKWISLMKTYLRSDIVAFTTSAETAEIVGEMKAAVEAGRAPFIIDNEHNLTLALDSMEDDSVTFNGEKNGTTYYISLSDTRHEQDDYDSRGIRIWDDAWYNYVETFIVFDVDDSGNLGGDVNIIRYNINEFYRVWFSHKINSQCESDCDQTFGQLKWVNTYYTEDNGDIRRYYIFSADIPVGTAIYTGVWGFLDTDDPSQSLETLSWTSGATYQSQNYPPYNP